ncbi:MAG: pyridoxal-phosphate dependent enzyme [Natronomonas sp.]
MLRCSDCDRRYDDRFRCVCGAPLDFEEYSLPSRRPGDGVDPAAGLWTFESLLPVERRVSLGEGFTPLLEDDEVVDGIDVSVKLDYLFPSGSFKDRGATATVSRALALGVDRVVEDSSGNAGAAIATYAARAGIDAEIYVPASAPQSKTATIERTGADIVAVEGSREAVTEACLDRIEDAEDAWYASHAWRPSFLAGTSTMAHEIVHQRGYTAPDAVVIPLGHGTMFLGAYYGFRDLKRLGWIDRLPRLLGAQAAGYAPIAAACQGGPGDADRNDLADGVQIREPIRRETILAAIDASDGDAIAISASKTEAFQDRLHRRGYHVEPTCAIAPAAAAEYYERGVLDSGDDVVIPLSGRK